ncbi:hypothetical protein HK098_005937 [Nowakowskiella sp. JEL0407]|nr:hypothetical protein HK098_005937 [Nowakowskiella sp. JEL0407]
MPRQSRVYKRYDTTAENAREVLNANGVATIPNVISAEECARLRTDIYNQIKIMSRGQVDVDDPSTYTNFLDLFRPMHSMLMQRHSIGHIQPVWDIRQNPAVVEAFAKIWNSKPENMITSFDGISMFFPKHTTPMKGWFHLDQGPAKRGFQCIQGQISLFDIRAGDATLNVLESSHKFHDEYFDRSPARSTLSDFVMIDDLNFYKESGCQDTFVEADAGSLILWDSRTVHQGSIPTGDAENKFRLVVYVCMMPRDFADPYQLQQRIDAFDSLRMTTHYPTPIKLFPLTSKSRRAINVNLNNEIKLPDPPILTELGRRLVGFGDYEEDGGEGEAQSQI